MKNPFAKTVKISVPAQKPSPKAAQLATEAKQRPQKQIASNKILPQDSPKNIIASSLSGTMSSQQLSRPSSNRNIRTEAPRVSTKQVTSKVLPKTRTVQQLSAISLQAQETVSKEELNLLSAAYDELELKYETTLTQSHEVQARNSELSAEIEVLRAKVETGKKHLKERVEAYNVNLHALMNLEKLESEMIKKNELVTMLENKVKLLEVQADSLQKEAVHKSEISTIDKPNESMNNLTGTTLLERIGSLIDGLRQQLAVEEPISSLEQSILSYCPQPQTTVSASCYLNVCSMLLHQASQISSLKKDLAMFNDMSVLYSLSQPAISSNARELELLQRIGILQARMRSQKLQVQNLDQLNKEQFCQLKFLESINACYRGNLSQLASEIKEKDRMIVQLCNQLTAKQQQVHIQTRQHNLQEQQFLNQSMRSTSQVSLDYGRSGRRTVIKVIK